jgi:hypothetical protein
MEKLFLRKGEMLPNGVIGRGHLQFFQLPEGHPPKVMTSDGFEQAFLNPTTIDQE